MGVPKGVDGGWDSFLHWNTFNETYLREKNHGQMAHLVGQNERGECMSKQSMHDVDS